MFLEQTKHIAVRVCCHTNLLRQQVASQGCCAEPCAARFVTNSKGGQEYIHNVIASSRRGSSSFAGDTKQSGAVDKPEGWVSSRGP